MLGMPPARAALVRAQRRVGLKGRRRPVMSTEAMRAPEGMQNLEEGDGNGEGEEGGAQQAEWAHLDKHPKGPVLEGLAGLQDSLSTLVIDSTVGSYHVKALTKICNDLGVERVVTNQLDLLVRLVRGARPDGCVHTDAARGTAKTLSQTERSDLKRLAVKGYVVSHGAKGMYGILEAAVLVLGSLSLQFE
ncbi:hypothetical protein WJX72_004029 [[Myrmecia] bisecta]|uniref:Uncharacterized protein n=1 Tax=[Myrmecia] bisecta TaxID=41462 RepID=A0AAW1PK34_9CHLO